MLQAGAFQLVGHLHRPCPSLPGACNVGEIRVTVRQIPQRGVVTWDMAGTAAPPCGGGKPLRCQRGRLSLATPGHRGLCWRCLRPSSPAQPGVPEAGLC